MSTPIPVVRVDGKNFSTLSRSLLEQPFDARFTAAMQSAALEVAQSDAPVVCAYTQSDEASYVLRPGWFGDRPEKVVSVLASYQTAFFARAAEAFLSERVAAFDARLLWVDGVDGLADYLDERHTDAVKNSISMMASSRMKHGDLLGMSTSRRLSQLGGDWERLDPAVQGGSLVVPRQARMSVTYWDGRTRENVTTDAVRTVWDCHGVGESMTVMMGHVEDAVAARG